MVDMHCHILPGIDDGAESMEESLEMLSIAANNGVTAIVATPHFYFDDMDSAEFLAKRRVLTEELRERGKSIENCPDIIEGVEVAAIYEMIGRTDLRSLCIGGTNHMLLELPFQEYPHWINELIYSLELSGITPIIAHPERNRQIRISPELLYGLVCGGVPAQLNINDMGDVPDRNTMMFFKTLIENHLVHFFGTDAHGSEWRTPAYGKFIAELKAAVDVNLVDMCVQNGEKLITEGSFFPKFEPRVPNKKRRRFFFGKS